LGSCHSSTKSYKNGDLIFQISRSSQSKAIQLATHSKYSHCGIIYQKGTEYFVFEAVQPVKLTPLNEWIARGEKHHFVVKRLKNAESILTPKVLDAMQKEGKNFKEKIRYLLWLGRPAYLLLRTHLENLQAWCQYRNWEASKIKGF
jgi:hypothetical protein